ncbi:DegV family EDD domain-containing protein [Alkalibaculum sp. M08DMB]|uniref:DegV family EDD domain-containing protein n=1 Tax=Alkalibaculum sporogenes TaxID=2655001 RepID=A0A6A7KAN5_9FIRM|nr:DegV family protein [Alkalibaculum sporogenes]MPW26570.1 DegV family EDD domain-containing protein [Alkalibaculum sporogenes]
MDYNIVVGSSCDFNDEYGDKINYSTVPFTITIDDENYRDDESFTGKKIVEKMKNSALAIKTACPSPNEFLESYKKGENVFVVTISSKLSGTYNSAITAKNMYLEQFENKFIHIFDSLSAAIAETMIVIKIKELIDEENSLNEIVQKVDMYIKELRTLFVLEKLDNLIKNGRMSKLTGKFAQFLHIKPILSEDGSGEIKMIDKSRGTKSALKKLVDHIATQGVVSENKKLGIVHCNDLDKALFVKKLIEDKYNFKEIIITEANGLSAVYSDDGGIIIAY